MLLALRDFRRFGVRGTDADVGTVTDVLFDDRDWSVRYLAVDTGAWLQSRPVLLSPELVGGVASDERTVHVTVDKGRVAESPPVQSHPPVSRHREDAMRAYFGLGPLHHPHQPEVDVWGRPTRVAHSPATEKLERATDGGEFDPHLRSAVAWLGYGVEGVSAHLGEIDDLLLDLGETWRMRFIVVRTGGWLSNKRRLVATEWVRSVSHDARHVRVPLDRERVAEAPDFEHADDIDHGAERWLFHHYGFTPQR